MTYTYLLVTLVVFLLLLINVENEHICRGPIQPTLFELETDGEADMRKFFVLTN